MKLRNSASRWFLLQEYITMHGPLNVKPVVSILWILVSPVGTYQDSIKFQGRSYSNDGCIGVHTV